LLSWECDPISSVLAIIGGTLGTVHGALMRPPEELRLILERIKMKLELS